MGYMRHHAILVSGEYGDWLDRAWTTARDMGCGTSEIVASGINDVRTFVVVPDGSKEGWPESDAGDTQRAAFVQWLEGCRYRDGSSPLKWAEVQYGDDERQCLIVTHTDASLAGIRQEEP